MFIQWFDVIVFRNGYKKNAPEITIQCKSISKGLAKPEWSDNWEGEVFIISLGKIVDTKNIENCPCTDSEIHTDKNGINYCMKCKIETSLFNKQQ